MVQGLEAEPQQQQQEPLLEEASSSDDSYARALLLADTESEDVEETLLYAEQILLHVEQQGQWEEEQSALMEQQQAEQEKVEEEQQLDQQQLEDLLEDGDEWDDFAEIESLRRKRPRRQRVEGKGESVLRHLQQPGGEAESDHQEPMPQALEENTSADTAQEGGHSPRGGRKRPSSNDNHTQK